MIVEKSPPIWFIHHSLTFSLLFHFVYFNSASLSLSFGCFCTRLFPVETALHIDYILTIHWPLSSDFLKSPFSSLHGIAAFVPHLHSLLDSTGSP